MNSSIASLTVLVHLLCLSPLFSQVPSVINVEIDWMETPGHSHRPNQAEIDAVVQMFACQGITLNVVVSNQVPHINVLLRDPNDSTNFFGYTGTNSYGGIKAANFNNNPGGWHYCVFGHQYQNSSYVTTGSSGLANSVGDLIVTLGGWPDQIGSPWDRAATFAHELGHNLGLSHVGSLNENTTTPYVVNLPSVMTYYYQLEGVRTRMECFGLIPPGLTLFKDLDYSRGISCALNENALDENFGMGIVKVDWNCSGSIGGTVAHDLASATGQFGWCNSGGTRSNLVDYNEWANIRDITAATLQGTELVKEAERTTYHCITYEEASHVASMMGGCPQATLVTEQCISNTMRYVRPGAGGSQTGTCSNPHVSMVQAYNASSDGDILYLAPGTYTVGRSPLTKRLLLGGPGGVTVTVP